MKKIKKTKQTEKEVKIALKYADDIIATLREPFLVINKNLRVISVNNSFYTTFKAAEKETIGQLLPNLGNGQWNIPKLIHLLKEILPQKTVVTNYEIEHEFQTIGYRTMNLNALQLRIPKKIATLITAKTEEEEEEEEEEELILLAIEDITARKELEKKLVIIAEEKEDVREKLAVVAEKLKISYETLEQKILERTKDLQQAKAQDEAILLSIGDAVVACDKDGIVLLFNGVAEALTGYSTAKVIGHHYNQALKFVQESDEKASDDFIAKTITTGQATKMVNHTLLIAKGGRKIPVADSAAPIRDAKGVIIGCVVVFRDVTKEMEIDRAKTEFISIASHQLRTPVSALNWVTEALLFNSKNLTSKQKIYLEDLSTMTKRLIKLVEDLLDFSRLQVKSLVVTEKHKIKILEFLEEFTKEIETFAVSKKHSIILNNKIIESLMIEINKRSLSNILQNLTSNAIDYSPQDTVVTINLEKINGSIKISISNKGLTIPKEEQPHLFERFYRGESAKKIKSEGTGMGLYIAKKEVEDLGGKIGLESVEGKDTMFWFTIPLKVSSQS